MSTTPQNTEDNKPLRIRRGRVESVDLYEIKDWELELFRKGSPTDLHLNFAIFLLSIAFSAIVALSTAAFSNENVKTTFIFVAVVGILLGGFLLISWRRGRTSLGDVCTQIRQRIKETDLVISETSVTRTEIAIGKLPEPTEPKDK